MKVSSGQILLLFCRHTVCLCATANAHKTGSGPFISRHTVASATTSPHASRLQVAPRIKIKSLSEQIQNWLNWKNQVSWMLNKRCTEHVLNAIVIVTCQKQDSAKRS